MRFALDYFNVAQGGSLSPPIAGGINLFPAGTSGGANGENGWTVQSPIVVTTGLSDFMGGTDGYSYAVASGGAFKQAYTQSAMQLHSDGYLGAGNNICFGVRIQNVNLPSGTQFQLVSAGGGFDLRVFVFFASATSKTLGSVSANSALTSLDGSVGYTDLGNDYYMIWGTVPTDDLGAYDDWILKFIPFRSSNLAAEVMYSGAQVNPGTEPCAFVPVAV